MQRIDEYLVAFKDFDYSCSLGYINGQLRQKVNDVIQMKSTLSKAFNFMLWFFFSFAFENKHRFKNFFALTIEGIGTM